MHGHILPTCKCEGIPRSNGEGDILSEVRVPSLIAQALKLTVFNPFLPQFFLTWKALPEDIEKYYEPCIRRFFQNPATTLNYCTFDQIKNQIMLLTTAKSNIYDGFLLLFFFKIKL